MDLNQVPSDHFVTEVKLEENNVGKFIVNCNSELDDFRKKFNGVEQGFKDVEIKRLGLEIRKKDIELEVIGDNIRVLEGERVLIEKEVTGLRKKKAILQGFEKVGDGFLLNDKNNVDLGFDELSSFDQLMIENKVLECEKRVALKEVVEWKRKFKELELRTRELEGRLKGQGEDSDLVRMREGAEVSASRPLGVASCSTGTMDGGMKLEGSPLMGTRVKRRLAFHSDKRFDEKIAPHTPAGARPSSVSVIDIDSDDEAGVPSKPEPFPNGEAIPSLMPRVGSSEMEDELEDEDESSGTGKDFVVTQKRKRDFNVVTSDDEVEDHEVMPTRRAVRIDDSESEAEDNDDTRPIKQIFGRPQSICESDDDDIPISQLRITRAQCSRQPAELPVGTSSGQKSYNLRGSQTRKRRSLVISDQGTQRNRVKKMDRSSSSLVKNFVEDDESERDDSESDASLDGFIVKDSDVNENDLSENGSDPSEEIEETSDDNLDLEHVISKFQSRRDPSSKWVLADMLSDMGKDPELCMRAVCALCRRQTTEEQLCKDSIVQNGRGFSKFDAPRGTTLGEFLTGGDRYGDVVKTVEELKEYNPEGPDTCRNLAVKYSRQLFEIYENDEDPYFP